MCTYLELVLVVDHLCRTVVYGHGSLREPVVFLVFCVHEEDGLAGFRRTFLQSLFEQVSCSLNFGITLNRHQHIRLQEGIGCLHIV